MTDSISNLSPSEVILARSRAFGRGDFGFIFDTYHSESNFRRQFVSRDEYIQTGRTGLSQDYQILDCLVVAERQESPESQVIFLIEMKVQGVLQKYAELAWLRLEEAGWRYHRGQKMTAEQLPEQPLELNFADFAKLDSATIF